MNSVYVAIIGCGWVGPNDRHGAERFPGHLSLSHWGDEKANILAGRMNKHLRREMVNWVIDGLAQKGIITLLRGFPFLA
jgi:hypothetical protein